ncbi:hypothetical protein A2960_01635 [Candidatus Gottesmanbacteria bacterium RIFCSPLOWO2_01_FULL_39_12b]|uniref:DUF3105 domain-containing protein n=1 Tax=Candidatus Gottesmanbacteria bacterium RIFCSPLOWO2_01_FULL_39_12b TaxID=1798388 RepID=A0A1F6ARE3_9BACT|nr:MAG: hypothetical protein A2960_01635 [Candidatus Gottesmanbacteria bacterium RIFCSPLOWO2_01_FULL_39_12b]
MMNEFENLTKKERKRLKKTLENQASEKVTFNKKIRRYIAVGIIILISSIVIYRFIKNESSSKPGQSMPDLGRDHVKVGTNVSFNSNPPASGSHYEEWEKSGIYAGPLDDRKLVHSLEHGYIIISYNCDWKEKSKSVRIVPNVLAHEEDLIASSSAYKGSSSSHLELNEWKNNQDCQELVKKLEMIGKNKAWKKIIVVPRPNLDNRIALTAWTKLDKFDIFDENRILLFINSYWDHGPEQTIE